jgi:hypothetical protein
MGQRTLNLGTSCAAAAIWTVASAGVGCYTSIPTVYPDGGGTLDDGGLDGGGGSDGVTCNATYPMLCAAAQTCVDPTSDGKNCGACGHDCLGGACVGGQCQPVPIAQYIGNPMTMYVGAEAVYVTTDLGYVGRARKDGSDLKPFAMPGFASSAFIGTLLAEDGDRVFLSRYTGSSMQVSYCSTSGCDSTATPVGGPYTEFFAVDQENHKIVWVDYTPARLMSSSTIGTISGVDVPGGTLASGTIVSRLFYSQGGIYFSDGNINRIPVAGGSAVVVTSGPAPLTILGANSASLFVYDGREIGSVPLPNGDGGSPKLLFAVALNVGGDGRFAADDTSVYWAGSNGQAVTCQIANCSGTQKTLPKRAVDSVWDIGSDAEAVYSFAQSGSLNSTSICTVWKLAK